MSLKRDGQAAADFGARLRASAARRGLSAADLARMADIAKQTMSAYWNGARLCGADRLFVLADILRVDPRWLVEGETGREAQESEEQAERLLAAFALLGPRERAALLDIATAITDRAPAAGSRRD